jgi:hypothetical protein
MIKMLFFDKFSIFYANNILEMSKRYNGKSARYFFAYKTIPRSFASFVVIVSQSCVITKILCVQNEKTTRINPMLECICDPPFNLTIFKIKTRNL